MPKLFGRKKLTTKNDIINAALDAFDYTPHWWYYDSAKRREVERNRRRHGNTDKEIKVTDEELSILKVILAEELRRDIENLRNKDITPKETKEAIARIIGEYQEKSKNIRTYKVVTEEYTTHEYEYPVDDSYIGSSGDTIENKKIPVIHPPTEEYFPSHGDSRFEKELSKISKIVSQTNTDIGNDITKVFKKLSDAQDLFERNKHPDRELDYCMKALKLAIRHNLTKVKVRLVENDQPQEINLIEVCDKRLTEILNDPSKLRHLSKDKIYAAITSLPRDEQLKYLNLCLIRSTPLGAIMWKSRYLTDCSLEKGTLRKICDHLDSKSFGNDGKRIIQEAQMREQRFKHEVKRETIHVRHIHGKR